MEQNDRVQEGMEWATAHFQVSVMTREPPVATMHVGPCACTHNRPRLRAEPCMCARQSSCASNSMREKVLVRATGELCRDREFSVATGSLASQHGSLAAVGSWVVTRVFCCDKSFGTSVV